MRAAMGSGWIADPQCVHLPEPGRRLDLWRRETSADRALSITLAVRNHRLGLATALTGIPSLYNLTGLTVSTLWTLINGL
jgi:hypothetical protein